MVIEKNYSAFKNYEQLMLDIFHILLYHCHSFRDFEQIVRNFQLVQCYEQNIIAPSHDSHAAHYVMKLKYLINSHSISLKLL